MTELERARDKICDYVDGIDETPNFQHLLDNWERLVREDERERKKAALGEKGSKS